jgi:hypothetical protein
MKTGFRRIGVIIFLLALGMASAFAQGRRSGFTFYEQQAAQSQGMPGSEPQRQGDGRRMRGFAFPESSGFGANGDNSSGNAGDASRRPGKLSPEERRALRRQIDEAGHDIYRPRR